jgi:hypothetical protein
VHGRHYAGETARRLIKHAILSRLHASRALRAALRNASGRGAFCERACRISALVLGLRLLSPAGADAGQLRVGLNLFARAHLMATAWPYFATPSRTRGQRASSACASSGTKYERDDDHSAGLMSAPFYRYRIYRPKADHQ